MSRLCSFSRNLRAKVDAGEMPIEGQEKRLPKFWIEVTRGGSGWFAVMLWDGMGYPEPWENGDSRYNEQESAIVEGRAWAVEEKIEFIEPSAAKES